MLESSLIRVLSLSKLDKAKVLIPNKALLLEKTTTLYDNNHKRYSDTYKYVILLNEGQRVGGILFCGSGDLQCYIFKKYRNQGHMSNFMKSGCIQSICPNMKSITSIHEEGSKEYQKVEHLASLANLNIRQ